MPLGNEVATLRRIKLPNTRAYDRAGTGDHSLFSDKHCCVCGKPVSDPQDWLLLSRRDDGTFEFAILHPTDATADERQMALWVAPVGADCLRKNSELKPFVIDRRGAVPPPATPAVETHEFVEPPPTSSIRALCWKVVVGNDRCWQPIDAPTHTQPAATPARLEEIRARYEAAMKVIDDLNHARREWTMSIPARPDCDPDLIIAASLKDNSALLDLVASRDADIATLRTQLAGLWDEAAKVADEEASSWTHAHGDVGAEAARAIARLLRARAAQVGKGDKDG